MIRANAVLVALSLSFFAAGGVSPGSAQGGHGGSMTPDSLVVLLRSSDWKQRADGIARLNLLPARSLPSNYAEIVIVLLEQEAMTPSPHNDGESYGEYQLALVRGVLRLHDPRSLRGLALLGIQTSREAKEYVASQGASSIPFLDDAWQHDSGSQMAVATTWAYMVGRYRGTLSSANRHQVLARILSIRETNSLAFAWAAVSAPLPEAIPLLDDVGIADSREGRRQAAKEAAEKLRPQRDGLSKRELMARLSDWLDVICSNSAAIKGDACQSLVAGLADAASKAGDRDRTALRASLAAFVNQADSSRSANTLSPAEYRLLAGNAQYLKERS